MSNHSDTESESEIETDSPLYSPQIGAGEGIPFNGLGSVQAAIETLKRIDIHDVLQACLFCLAPGFALIKTLGHKFLP
jgi:hypothetical protein